jgi:hypothetical protein
MGPAASELYRQPRVTARLQENRWYGIRELQPGAEGKQPVELYLITAFFIDQ